MPTTVADEPIDDAPLPDPRPRPAPEPPADASPATTPIADADPLRPYRVHELLTRHAQGKRRGRVEQDARSTRHAAPTIRRPSRTSDGTQEDER